MAKGGRRGQAAEGRRQRRGEGSGGAEGAEPPKPRSAVAAECRSRGVPARAPAVRPRQRARWATIYSFSNIRPTYLPT